MASLLIRNWLYRRLFIVGLIFLSAALVFGVDTYRFALSAKPVEVDVLKVRFRPITELGSMSFFSAKPRKKIGAGRSVAATSFFPRARGETLLIGIPNKGLSLARVLSFPDLYFNALVHGSLGLALTAFSLLRLRLLGKVRLRKGRKRTGVVLATGFSIKRHDLFAALEESERVRLRSSRRKTWRKYGSFKFILIDQVGDTYEVVIDQPDIIPVEYWFAEPQKFQTGIV